MKNLRLQKPLPSEWQHRNHFLLRVLCLQDFPPSAPMHKLFNSAEPFPDSTYKKHLFIYLFLEVNHDPIPFLRTLGESTLDNQCMLRSTHLVESIGSRGAARTWRRIEWKPWFFFYHKPNLATDLTYYQRIIAFTGKCMLDRQLF